MDILKLLMQQDMTLVIPTAIAGLTILHWTFKLMMMLVKVGVTLSLIAALCIYLPHIQ